VMWGRGTFDRDRQTDRRTDILVIFIYDKPRGAAPRGWLARRTPEDRPSSPVVFSYYCRINLTTFVP